MKHTSIPSPGLITQSSLYVTLEPFVDHKRLSCSNVDSKTKYCAHGAFERWTDWLRFHPQSSITLLVLIWPTWRRRVAPDKLLVSRRVREGAYGQRSDWLARYPSTFNFFTTYQYYIWLSFSKLLAIFICGMSFLARSHQPFIPFELFNF